MAEEPGRLTVDLRKVGSKYGRTAYDESNQTIFTDPERSPFHFGEREAFSERRVLLPSGEPLRVDGQGLTLDAILAAIAKGDREYLDRALQWPNIVYVGECLARGLFGDLGEQRFLFSRVFGVPQDERTAPNCMRGPVRLVVRTDGNDLDLLNLPWRWLAWDQQPLRRKEWSFAVQAGTEFPTKAHTLLRPCKVLIVAPTVAQLETDAHVDYLKGLLNGIDPGFGERITRAQTAEEFKAGIDAQPDIVYFYGHGLVLRSAPCLNLTNGPVSIASVADWIASVPEKGRPRLVFLNGCFTGATWLGAGRQLQPFVPAIVVNPFVATAGVASRIAFSFFERLLAREEEPVVALAQAAPSIEPAQDALNAVCWSTYAAFNLSPRRATIAPDDADLVLQLDRRRQRDDTRRAVEDLLRGSPPEARVAGVVYSALGGNVIEAFGPSARAYVKEEVRRDAELVPLENLSFPRRPVGTAAAAGTDLKVALATMAGGPNLKEYLDGRARGVRAGRRVVFWLDWGTYGHSSRRALSDNEVVLWHIALREHLARHLPEGTIAVSLVGRQFDNPEMLVTSRDRLQAAVSDETLHVGSVIVQLLDQLEPVKENHIVELLNENHAIFGLGAQERVDLARCLWNKTGGQYLATIAALREAFAIGVGLYLFQCRNKDKK